METFVCSRGVWAWREKSLGCGSTKCWTKGWRPARVTRTHLGLLPDAQWPPEDNGHFLSNSQLWQPLQPALMVQKHLPRVDPGTQTSHPEKAAMWRSLFHFSPSCSPTVAPFHCQVSTWAMKIPGLASFPEMPVKAQAAIHPKYQFYSAVCVSIIYLPAFLLQYVPVNKISN